MMRSSPKKTLNNQATPIFWVFPSAKINSLQKKIIKEEISLFHDLKIIKL